jgi:hypothetical protein
MHITRRNNKNRSTNLSNANINRIPANTSRLNYAYSNSINPNIISILPNSKFNKTKKNTLKRNRVLTIANLGLPSDPTVKSLIENINIDIVNMGILGENPRVAYLDILMNKWDNNINAHPNIGTVILNSKKRELVGNYNLGPLNPEYKKYFINKGSGKVLLTAIINDLRENSDITTLIIHPANKNLEKYYKSNFNFKPFPNKVILIPEIKNNDGSVIPPSYYGDGSSGDLLYLHLRP